MRRSNRMKTILCEYVNARLVRGVIAAVVVGSVSAPVSEAGNSPHRRVTDPKQTSTRESQNRLADNPKLTVRVTPLILLTRSDARGIVTVPRHHDNRVLRVILESDDYFSTSDIQLDGEDAAQNHLLYWRGLPPGSYSVTVEVYGSAGLRDSTHIGTREPTTFR